MTPSAANRSCETTDGQLTHHGGALGETSDDREVSVRKSYNIPAKTPKAEN